MHNIWTIAKREFKHYFISPIFYFVALMLFVILGIIFYANIAGSMIQQFPPSIQGVLGPLMTILLFATPAITMRLIAEEQRLGTIELLLTAPVRDWELVVGKWLGGFLFMLTILAVTWLYPIVMNQMVSPGIDQGPLVTGYLGVVLFSAALVAIGVAVSSLFANQLAVFASTLLIYLILWLISVPLQATGASGGELVRYLSIGEHFYNTFYQGIIDLSDVIYFLSLTALALFLGSISVETRRWR